MSDNKPNPHVGSRFEDYLEEVGELDSATAVALKRLIALQLTDAMKAAALPRKPWPSACRPAARISIACSTSATPG